jgi:ElaB/YqjD/DUF883 family membrane-anchored ribosome-binding protein
MCTANRTLGEGSGKIEGMDANEQARKREEKAAEIGRLAGKFIKTAGPRARRFVEESRPKVEKAVQDARPKVEKAVEVYRPVVEKAGRDAVKYAQEHPEEVKGLAMKGARMRLGPLAMAIDALGLGQEPSQPSGPAGACPECRKSNEAGAKFCSECGQRLPGSGRDNKTA